MSCTTPLNCWHSKNGGITFKFNEAWTDRPLKVSCGQCIGCRLARSREWAIRGVHEEQLHEESYFVTLTYDNDHLPMDGSLNPRDLQLFIKRLRKHYKNKLRYIACGEYGDQLGRPHYHLIIYGLSLPDKVFYKKTEGYILFNSPSMSKIWNKGHVVIGGVSFESIAYVARYITKKITGSDATAHYKDKLPEFLRCSTRPGIGYDWIKKYCDQTYKSDTININGRQVKPPRYYDKYLELTNPKLYDTIKASRRGAAIMRPNDSDRLYARHCINIAKFKLLVRKLEE